MATYQKKLCMTELSITKTQKSGRFSEKMTPEDASLIFLFRGLGTVCTAAGEFSLSPGQLLFLPESEPYDALWTGKEIEWIRLSIVSRKFDLENTLRHPPQIVQGLCGEKTGALFEKLYALFATGDRVEKIRAIGHYYLFYASLLPLLTRSPSRAVSPALRCATSYVEAHFAEDFSMEELARQIPISTSRMFHLFQKELGTTPIRYRNKCRIDRAAAALRSGRIPPNQIAEECGFHSEAYFREIFKKTVGKTPHAYRKEWE